MPIAYDPSWSATTRPGSDTDFFAIGGDFTKDDVLCAEMARVAYASWDGFDRTKFDTYLSHVGFRTVQTVDVHGSEAFVASDGKTTVVSFRGTQPSDPFDLFTDSRFLKSDWSTRGQVHNGFRASINEIWPQVEKAIEDSPGDRLLYTGHSLGAALATLAASLRPPQLLVTLASPRVGDAEFGETVADIKHHRYVNCADVVPRVPTEGMGYVHTGVLHYINADGTIVTNPPQEHINSERRVATDEYREFCSLLHGTIPSRELADHAPINYCSAILGVRAADS
ncbi:lipase family protein [Smaragdicoccus niigatensis]|uniref:lipase family protein n=1 Tax=Smaragdicoccus niigatensis TaxID=359359 RepID=UPI00035FECDA|nr:lipase family protein [Smaragdicoccus niigatensis]